MDRQYNNYDIYITITNYSPLFPGSDLPGLSSGLPGLSGARQMFIIHLSGACSNLYYIKTVKTSRTDSTLCPRSLDPRHILNSVCLDQIYLVTFFIKWVKTSCNINSRLRSSEDRSDPFIFDLQDPVLTGSGSLP